MYKIIRKISVLSLVFSLLSGCSKDEPSQPSTPVALQFSSSLVEVEEGKTTEVSITKGVAPYTLTSSSPSVATATVNGSKIAVQGVKAGTATLTVKGNDGGTGTVNVNVSPPPDPYAEFKADASPRFEGGDQPTVKLTDASHLFYVDKGELFSSTKKKIGYATRDGSLHYFIEWEGDASVGVKANPTLRTETAVFLLLNLQVVKSEGGTIWIIARRTETSPEDRIVGKY